MAVLTATFETGVNGAFVSAADPGSATAWDSVNGTPSYNTLFAYQTLEMTTNSDGDYCVWSTALGTVTEYYGRVYLYMGAFPGTAWQIVRVYSGGTVAATVVFINSSGQLQIGSSNAGLGTSTNSVVLNQWNRVEFHVIHSVTVGFVEAKLFTNADSTTPTEVLTSTSNNNTLASADSVRIGRDTGGSGGTLLLDNIVFNAASYPGPFGAAEQPQVLSMQSHVFGHGVW